ncbi:NAD(P)H-hydrate dehydratase [Magnetospira thiophila]
MTEILTLAQMYDADRLAMASGIPGVQLMEAAGWAVARVLRQGWKPRPLLVLCGPGNNGGDGFVVARLLARQGWPVRVALLGERSALKGDAARMAERWTGPVSPLGPEALDRCHLVVDALFGAGLTRPLDAAAAATVHEINRRGLPCVAVDMPSGIAGDSGAVLGCAPRCVASVTFFRPKPGHLLQPGRDYCGALTVAPIGIPDSVLETLKPRQWHNHPRLWQAALPRPGRDSHKYTRGHLIIQGGGRMTGAARLAAAAARRAGTGLVSLAVPPSMLFPYLADQPGILVRSCPDDADFGAILADSRVTAVLLGPGAGVGEGTRSRVTVALNSDRPLVLDADALSSFAEQPDRLFGRLRPDVVLTPHEGEFRRLFDLSGDKLTRVRTAARHCGAVVLLKGADTCVAAPDGRAVICTAGPSSLATGGSGDVLAGLVAGLLAQGMPAFEAACAGTWVLGQSARAVSGGLIAEDLPPSVGNILCDLR